MHLLTEGLILMLSLAGIVYFGRLYYQFAQSKINLLTQDLALANQQAQQWREANRELIAGLAVQIQKQFDSWQLTPAEAEIGMLMLKGLSHGEIAHVRNASERTVRDQARAIYRKSGVTGRTELSAFFLEDLLLPRQQS
jgi:DNA-binding NarL/FixJ family response regulator